MSQSGERKHGRERGGREGERRVEEKGEGIQKGERRGEVEGMRREGGEAGEQGKFSCMCIGLLYLHPCYKVPFPSVHSLFSSFPSVLPYLSPSLCVPPSATPTTISTLPHRSSSSSDIPASLLPFLLFCYTVLKKGT